MLSPKDEPWYPGAVGSVFGAKAEVSPLGNKKPAFGAEMLAGTTGTGKVGGSKAWELPVGVAKGWRIGLSKGLQTAVPGLELKKTRFDSSFWNRGHWLFPADSLGGALGAGSVRLKQSSSSSSKQRVCLCC